MAIFKNTFSVILAIVIGFGAGLPAGDLSYITLFAVVSVVANIFKTYSKIYSAIGVLLADFVLGLFFIVSKSFDLII